MREDIAELRRRLVERLLAGPGRAAPGARRAAFDNQGVEARARALVDKVARHAWKVTDQDVSGVKAAGLSEDEIFELAVCAAVGHATRQLEAGLAAVDAAAGADRVPDAAAGGTR